ncbi:ABC transporter ATP-binding protein [Notoacmeibacter sp. MSK16QG-6]|uniref:ABC transporter ATP-binding protein n=1 Tax=Notoacmeibacter sp. MSK16QG-6 TaxID=2957982 RepID=UPI0020A057B3|nr:sn-glycerol-3-phosphate ABC transporter ATP-binding protein UgpC [Notoacmeibacter sp. MSK16QG-6]MCP1200459.1 sn-glycerol-3-phosphate ABC transporter ATP-binding protein UgpC [Notoacmeibacter sp. MSK16QG-6]
MKEIVIENLGKTFGTAVVFSDLNLEIEEGEFVVLVGPSGCGKSTLLRIIAGLEDVSAGNLYLNGERVNNKPAKQRDIAMVFQSYALYPHMNVADNMSFALRLSGVSKAERAERVKAAAEILGLSELLDRLPRELSGGQRQRVAMGRAIVRDPKAFLFDEPLSNLDAKLRHKMRGEIRKIHQRLGRTTVYVTHDQTEAMTMADRIVVMNNGKIEQAGTPTELYGNPDNLFVAGFIGTPEINRFGGTVRNGVVHLDCDLAFPADLQVDSADDCKVVCGVRPHHILIVEDGLEAEVLLVEPTGEGQEIQAMAGGHEVTIVADAQMDVEVGQTVHMRIDAAKAFLFDADTGRRLR